VCVCVYIYIYIYINIYKRIKQLLLGFDQPKFHINTWLKVATPRVMNILCVIDRAVENAVLC